MRFGLLIQLKKEGVLIKEQKAQDQKQGQGELPVSGSQKDRSKKYLEAYPDVFADIVNVLILGEKTIAAEDLRDGPTESVYKAESGEEYLEHRRDVAKYVTKDGVEIMLLGLENQTVPDYDMVFRMMGYDYTSYRGQIKTGKRRYPVISAVLYFGEKPWCGPCTLQQALQVPKRYKNVFADYKINVIDVCRIPEEKRSMLTSDFGVVADFFANRKRKDYAPSKKTLDHAEAVLHLLKVFTHDKRYAEIESEIIRKSVKGEPISMCEFAERMETQGIQKGIQKGIETERITSIKNMLEFGITEAQLLEKGYLQSEIEKAKEKLCV